MLPGIKLSRIRTTMLGSLLSAENLVIPLIAVTKTATAIPTALDATNWVTRRVLTGQKDVPLRMEYVGYRL